MCGIVGQVSFDKTVSNSFIKKGLEIIAHRGKDARDYIMTPFVAMGHNLLSITGVPTPQPIYNENHTIVAAVNGEFYDYESIVKELNLKFTTQSDSELIIQLYQRGLLLKYLENGKLNGEFSFYLYDIEKNKILLGRDSFGIKPLYIYRKNSDIYISSEIKAFLAVDTLSFDDNSLYSVLSMQYHDTASTLFKDVKQVQPGTVLIIDIPTRSITEQQYFNMSFEENYNSLEDNKIVLLEKLNASVARRMKNTKKTGIALSGGIDSASILALASKHTHKVNAYTISFKNGAEFDEYIAAEEMAKLYNANFTPIEVDEQTLLDNLETSIYSSEQVSVNMHVASKYLLFKKMADDGCKISLSGEGSDEVLFGYPHFKMDLDFDSNFERNKYLTGLQVPDKDMLNTEWVKDELGFVPTFIKAKYSMGHKIHTHLLKEDYVKTHINTDPASSIIRSYQLSKEAKPIFNSSILWSKICMSNYILNALGDKLEMSQTIEGRVPFLDREFFDFARTIPIDQKIKGGNEKFILKEAMKPFLTECIYNKQKHPFVAPPLFNWKNSTPVHDHLMDIIHSSRIANSEVFDQQKMLTMVNDIMKGTLNANTFDPVIMIIFSLYYLDKNFC
jgi:asparagine synthase (glutamine-hydrolysing)